MIAWSCVGGSQFIHPGTPYYQPPWSYAQQGPMQQGHSTNAFQDMLNMCFPNLLRTCYLHVCWTGIKINYAEVRMHIYWAKS